MGTLSRMAKNLLRMDSLIADYLRDGVRDAGKSYRDLAAETGMSINRIGIILRQEPPPVTVGELGLLAAAVGLVGSELIKRAEVASKSSNVVRAVFGSRSVQPAPKPPLKRVAKSRSRDRGGANGQG